MMKVEASGGDWSLEQSIGNRRQRERAFKIERDNWEKK